MATDMASCARVRARFPAIPSVLPMHRLRRRSSKAACSAIPDSKSGGNPQDFAGFLGFDPGAGSWGNGRVLTRAGFPTMLAA